MTSERNSAANVILHIGAGSFHRAHQAWYLHRLIDIGQTRAGRSPSAIFAAT